MAENFEGTKPLVVPLKPDQQKIEVKPDELGPNPETIEVLDKWFEEQVKKAAEEAPKADDGTPKPDDAAPKPDAPKPDDAKPDDAKPDAPKPDDASKPDATKSDPFSDIELPANARGKSAEAFAAVKERAAAEIQKIAEERDALKKQYEEAQAKLANPVPEDLTKELETLRQFRNKLDVEADPGFHRQFDGKIGTLEDFVYSQLKSTGKINEAGLGKIKEIGLDNVDWDDLFGKINNPQAQRLIQARLDEIAVTKFEKEKALDEAKKNVDAYINLRRSQVEAEAKQHNQATQKELDTLLPKMSWLAEEDKPLPPTATPDERAVWDDNRKFKTEVKECLKEALTDDSPSMRAILVAGMAQLLKLRRDFAVVDADRKKVSAALKEAQEKLDKIKKASIVRPKDSSAPPSDALPKPKVDYTMSAGEAMDALARSQGLLK